LDRIGPSPSTSGQCAETREWREGLRGGAGERLTESRCLSQEGGQVRGSGTRWSGWDGQDQEELSWAGGYGAVGSCGRRSWSCLRS
jgi:hypothetical protein